MKIFLSYRFTGEDPIELKENLERILNVLRANNHDVYCSIEDEAWFQEKKHTNKDIIEHAFNKLDEVDIVLVYIKSNEKSEGMLIEIGYALSKGKKIVLAIKNGISTTFVRQVADPVVEFDSLEDLCEKLKTF
ncbi:MAG: nucleoside 2-deoxyribosyltransferase [Minisyncoccia bacterium]